MKKPVKKKKPAVSIPALRREIGQLKGLNHKLMDLQQKDVEFHSLTVTELENVKSHNECLEKEIERLTGDIGRQAKGIGDMAESMKATGEIIRQTKEDYFTAASERDGAIEACEKKQEQVENLVMAANEMGASIDFLQSNVATLRGSLESQKKALLAIDSKGIPHFIGEESHLPNSFYEIILIKKLSLYEAAVMHIQDEVLADKASDHIGNAKSDPGKLAAMNDRVIQILMEQKEKEKENGL